MTYYSGMALQLEGQNLLAGLIMKNQNRKFISLISSENLLIYFNIQLIFWKRGQEHMFHL